MAFMSSVSIASRTLFNRPAGRHTGTCRAWAWVVSAFIAAIASSGSSSAALVAYWNFNSLSAAPDTATTISADSGAGTLYANGTQGSSSWVTATSGNQWNALGGDTTNALNSDTAGNALSPVNSSANGKSFTLAFSMAGLEDLVVTFATRGTATGFNSGLWAYSNDGTTFTSAGLASTATRNTTWALATADFSSISQLDNDGSVWIRYTLSGASSTSGNNRIDNLQVNASPVPVPEPPAFVLVAAGLGTLTYLARGRRGGRRSTRQDPPAAG